MPGRLLCGPESEVTNRALFEIWDAFVLRAHSGDRSMQANLCV